MTNFQVTKELLLDATPAAELIEARFGSCMPPAAAGVYSAVSLQPVLKPNHYYYQRVCPSRVAAPQEQAVVAIEEIRGNVYDIDAALVVPKVLVKSLSWQPVLPVRGLAVVAAAVDWVITDCSVWANPRRQPLNSVLAKHLKLEHQEDDNLLCRISELLFDLCHEVRLFIGEDKWVIHFHRQQGRDILVEKTVDWRVLDWERRMASGEWT